MTEHDAPDGSDGAPRAINVLYVEDNQQTGPLVREWLERHDARFEVSLAVTLDEATESIADERFDAVVADYRFPSGKGLDLVPMARDRNPGIPFLIYSAHVTDEVEDEAAAADVTAVVEKGGADQLSMLAEYIVSGATDGDGPPPAAAADDRLAAFADEVVHELRGPLSAALGHLDLLESEVDDERTDQLRESLTELEDVIDDLPARAARFDADADD